MKRKISLVLFLILIFPFALHSSAEVRSQRDILSCAEGIIEYKKGENENLFSGSFLDSAGSTAGDWYPFGMSLFGIEDDYSSYLTAIRDNVRQRYDSETLLSSDKATEWHRIILACLSCGGDPEKFCVTKSGDTVNLLEDGVYYRKNIARQGINGYIWGLVALNTRDYSQPQDAVNTKESLLTELLSRQNDNGSWSMTGDTDVDLTAMTLFAAAPFYGENSEASSAIERALSFLSEIQNENGGFSQDKVENCESCAVVITALCCLGIDPETDERFIKNGNSAVDALLGYRLENGSFTHSFAYDEDDPSAVPSEANDMSCQQALYALGALYNLRSGSGAVFDFRKKEISSKGFDVLPEEPGAVEKAADKAGERLNLFFSDENNRKNFVSVSLCAVIAVLAIIFIKGRKKKKK